MAGEILFYKKKSEESRKMITEDAVTAKSYGVTYGKFKAGVTKTDFEEDPNYKSKSTEYLRPTEKAEGPVKARAYIKKPQIAGAR